MNTSEVPILLVEDDDIDAMAVQRGLAAVNITSPLLRARDGVEALDILQGTNGKQKLKPPYLLLVDLCMPRLDGLGLVRKIRNTRTLQRTVIFILTSSDNDRDLTAAYDSHIAGYIVKSNAHDHFRRLASMLEYYLMIVSPPPIVAASA